MENFFASDNFTLLAILLSIIAIVALFLHAGRNQSSGKVHLYYISGLCAFIVIELATYICLNNESKDDIVSYISFAATISSLFLAVVAIIYAIVSNNKGEAQYTKIDSASNRITKSLDSFSQISNNLTDYMSVIVSRLDEVKALSKDTNDAVYKNFPNSRYSSGESKKFKTVEDLYDYFTQYGSILGSFTLLACKYSYDRQQTFSLKELFEDDYFYAWGYLIASNIMGILTTESKDKLGYVFKITNVHEKLETNIEQSVLDFVKSHPKYQSRLDTIQKYFGMDSTASSEDEDDDLESATEVEETPEPTPENK